MNKERFIFMIGQRLSGRDEEDLRDFISNEADLYQKGTLEAGADLPWFLERREELTIPLSGILDLPQGFIREDEDEGLYILFEEKEFFLKKKDAKQLRMDFKFTAKGVPQYYALVGQNQIEFFPKPHVEQTLFLPAYFHDTIFSELSPEESNLWMMEAEGVLMNGTGRVCSMIIRDDNAYKFFQAEEQRAQELLRQKDLERRLNGQEFYFGGQ